MKHHQHPRGGASKMMDGHMAPAKGVGHYEAHARGMHARAEGHTPRAGYGGPQHGAGNQAHSSKRGLPNSAKMPNPGMGKGRGRGGY